MKRKTFIKILITMLTFLLRFAESQNEEETNCTIIPKRTSEILRIRELVDVNRLIKFDLEIDGALGPFEEKFPGGLLNPKEWILLTEDSAKDLLLFPDNHVQKSLYALSFRTVNVQLSIFQRPENCLNKSITLTEIMNTIRMFIKNISMENPKEGFEICNRFVMLSDNNATGELHYTCCDGATNECRLLEPGVWLQRFNDYLQYLQIAVLFLCPLLIPKSFYRQFNPVFRCQTYGLSYPKLKVDKIKESEHSTSDRNRLGIFYNSFFFNRLKNSLKSLRTGTYFFQIETPYIYVDEENLVLEGTHHLGLKDYLYKNIANCHIKQNCTSLSICLDRQMCNCPKSNNRYSQSWHCQWLSCVKGVMYFFTFCLLTFPWWLTVMFYYSVNHSREIYLKNVQTSMNTTINARLTPYISETDFGLFFVTFVFFCVYNIFELFRLFLKDLVRYTFQGETRGFDIMSVVLCPVIKWGLLGCLLYPFWIIIMVPYIVVQTVPIFILLFNFYNLLLKRKIRAVFGDIVTCVCVGFVLFEIVGECLLFYTECIVYTTVGFLLNYDDVLPYVSFALLIGVYGYNCFHWVYVLFSEFNKLLSKETQKRMKNHIAKVDCPKRNETDREKEYINIAYMLPKTNDSLSNIDTRIEVLDNGMLKWKAPRLVSFLYNSEQKAEFYLSRKFFEDINKLEYTISPGDQGFLYLKSCLNFGFVTLFLFFVIVVVFALGKANDLSSGVQTLVALGGGFLPLILQKVFFRTDSKDVTDLKNSFWKKMVDFEVDSFCQWWDVIDIDLHPTPLNQSNVGNDQDQQLLHLIAIENNEEEIEIFILRDQQLESFDSWHRTSVNADVTNSNSDYEAI